MPESNSKESKEQFTIFVGTIEEHWDHKDVPVDDIMREAGRKDLKGLVLEALDGKDGSPVKEFKLGEVVDLSVPDRKYFRITPGGGGFS